MRIAVFTKKTTFHKDYGGMEVQNKILCEGLTKRGHEIVVFSPKTELVESELKGSGIRYVFVDCDYRYLLSSLNKKSWYNASFEAFKKEHSLKKFDLAISQSSAGIGIIERKQELGIKVFSIAHGTTMGEFRTFFVNNHSIKDVAKIVLNLQYSLRQFFGRQRQYILHSNKVVAVSSAVKRQLEEETFAPEDLISVIHNGVEKFEPNVGETVHTRKLVYVGKLTKEKGVDLFLDILKDFRFKDFLFDVIGDGPMEQDFRSALTQKHNTVNLKLLGNLSHEQVIDTLKTNYGAVFLFPTRRVEGLPMVLVEAMFAGLPVVAYDIGGVSDAVEDGKNGYLIRFGDKKGFLNRVLELAQDPVKINSMSKIARNTAEKEFGLETMLDRYEAIIREIIK